MGKGRIVVTGASQGIGVGSGARPPRAAVYEVLCVSRSGPRCSWSRHSLRHDRRSCGEGAVRGRSALVALSSALSTMPGFIANGPIAQIRTQDFEAMMRLNVTRSHDSLP